MATAGQAPCAAGFSETRRPAMVRKCLALSALSCALAVAGCASRPAERDVKVEPKTSLKTDLNTNPKANPKTNLRHAAAPSNRRPELKIYRPDQALLTPQPAPDCEFKGAAELKPVDPDLWGRLKLDYERQCYQQAESKVRERLKLLQASSSCEVEPVRYSPATGKEIGK